MTVKINKRMFALLIFFSFQNYISQAQQKSLEVGDKAPSLYIQEWVKGTPVLEFKRGEIYVVEFSGTWCAPCRKAIPHLTELAKKYASVVKVISVYNENNDKEKPEELNYIDKVHALVDAMGDKIDFIVAVDVPKQTTKERWGIRNWPSAFLVDTSGRIAWKGNPRDLDLALSQMTTGTFNLEIAVKQQEFIRCLFAFIQLSNDGDYEKALYGIDSLIKANPEKTWLYPEKFDMLVGYDDNQAYQLLEWMLDNNVKGLDWPTFINRDFSKIKAENRNYLIELKAIDRTIEESESKFHAALPLSIKASTYATMGNLRMAIEASKQAVEYSKAAGGDEETTKKYEAIVIIYQNALKAKVGCNKDCRKQKSN